MLCGATQQNQSVDTYWLTLVRLDYTLEKLRAVEELQDWLTRRIYLMVSVYTK